MELSQIYRLKDNTTKEEATLSVGDIRPWKLHTVFNAEKKELAVILYLVGNTINGYYSKESLEVFRKAASLPCIAPQAFPLNAVHTLREEDVPALRMVVNTEDGTPYPTVILSQTTSGAYSADYEKLLKSIGGFAHILLEPYMEYGSNAREKGVYFFPYRGAITVVMKGRRKTFKPESQWDDLTKEITEHVLRTATDNARVRYSVESISAAKVEESNAVTKLFEEDNSSLREEIESRGETLSRLIWENEQLRYEVERLKSQSGNGLLKAPETNEFFEGELRDFLINTLKRLPALPGTRQEELKNLFLEENEESGLGRGVMEDIRKALQSSNPTAELQRIGFEVVSENKHIRLTYKDNPRYKFTLAVTPSDRRAQANNVRDFMQTLNIYV